jgi:hypothetical protein
LLHEPGEVSRLGDVIGIRHESCGLGRDPGAAPLARRSLGNGLARRLGTRHPTPSRQFVKRTGAFVTEPQ